MPGPKWGERVPLLEVRDVVKKYRVGREVITALAGVTLEVEEGEFVAILGTSGCGKTTLLNIAAGLERPTRGQVIFRGVTISKLKEKQMVSFRRRQMGFVFQSYNLLPALTARENVSLPLVFEGLPVRERNIRAREVLAEVGLADRSRHKPSEMSGGQQQRTAIARALITRPKIIFADEPTGNLDTRTTTAVLELLRKAVKENNQTLLLVTHDRDVASFADRCILMVDGQIVSETRGGMKE
jgi:putative ABC transport system ATP-binding protein